MADAIRVLVRQEGDQWVAQCLDADICVQAPNLDALKLQVEVAIEADLRAIGQAPEYYFDIMPTVLPRYLS